MKRIFADTLFTRLFLLLFVTLTISNFIGITIFTRLEHLPDPNQLHAPPTSRFFWLLLRLVGSALTAWIAARWLSLPIKRMADAAQELGDNLQRAPLAENCGPLEVRQASVVFNQMQAHLQQQIAERSGFLAAISHDLRTPLTRLKLRAEKINVPELQTDIRRDLDEMTRMIDETLNYLREDNHAEAYQLLDVTALVNSIAEDMAEMGYTVTVDGQALPVMAQPLALRRCLGNLIENAVHYGNQAHISLHDSPVKLLIEVLDAGAGIPENQLETVFTPFYRVEDSRNRHTGGAGLGLSIAREIALKHHGQLSLQNIRDGGLKATLELPRNN